MNLNKSIAGYIAEKVPRPMHGQVLDILEAYYRQGQEPITFTGTHELATHMTNIASIIDNHGVCDERIAQSGN